MAIFGFIAVVLIGAWAVYMGFAMAREMHTPACILVFLGMPFAAVGAFLILFPLFFMLVVGVVILVPAAILSAFVGGSVSELFPLSPPSFDDGLSTYVGYSLAAAIGGGATVAAGMGIEYALTKDSNLAGNRRPAPQVVHGPLSFSEAIAHGFQNYANFSWRASRSAFWYWMLFCFLAGIITQLLDLVIFESISWKPINSLFSLATLIPSLAVGARRLHDIDRSGWWQLLHFLVIIGTIVLIVWFASRGTPGPNRFGENPLGE